MLSPEEVLEIFEKTGALLKGHFKLSSGLHSSEYLQCALVLQQPAYSKRICEELARKFKEDRPTVVMGPALGGIIVSYEAAKVLGVRAIFAERQEGKMTLRRGFTLGPEDRVLIVEDVITTGGSVKELIDLARQRGALVLGVAAIIDRSTKSTDLGVRYESLLKMEIETFPPQECPLCKKGLEITKPGSRVEKL